MVWQGGGSGGGGGGGWGWGWGVVGVRRGRVGWVGWGGGWGWEVWGWWGRGLGSDKVVEVVYEGAGDRVAS